MKLQGMLIMNTTKVRKNMRRHVAECRNNTTGELNHTQLAEIAADELELYLEDGYTIPDELFEIALEFN